MSYSFQKGISWPMVLLTIALLVVIAGLIPPMFVKKSKIADLTKDANNAKAIAMGLHHFRLEYGMYPCDATRKKLIENGEDRLPKGTSANAYLAQLIVTGMIDTETYFYAAGIDGVQKGDDIRRPGELLKKGENGFLYIMAQDGKSLQGDLGIIPLVMASVESRGHYPKFNTKIYGGKYLYGAVDGSSKQGNLGEDGTALSKDRAHLFETGPDSLFGGDIPTFTYPLGL